MPAIYLVLFATAAGTAVVVVATILVIIGVHQEERRGTLARRPPPTIPALLARRVLGAHVQLLPLDRPGEHGPANRPPIPPSPQPRVTPRQDRGLDRNSAGPMSQR